MSVIIGRAIPDIRDGLKPVHRRILYAMHDMGLRYNSPHRKSARVVGEVIGRFHPHGDMSIYNAMVRMGQDFSLRHPLVDGQGNFGSVDGDPPAAYRYTEARMTRIASELLVDIEKETVPFDPNFDETDKEPKYLPARIPNLLINGSTGIAVGMSTSIPPYNLGEIIEALLVMLERELPMTELIKIVKGPDFPTGGKIMGQKSIMDSYRTGRGTITLRAKMELEEKGSKRTIIVTEIPYMVNKAQMVKDIYDKVNDGLIKGITGINDESSRHGLRIVINLNRNAGYKIVKNKLFRQSRLQTTFRITNLVLDNGQPKVMNLKAMLQNFIDHRDDIIIKRTQYNLNKANERLHIIDGLLIALDNIDEIIEIIKKSPDPADANNEIITRFKLSDIQAEHILNMRLRRLTALEQQSLRDEKAKLESLVEEYQELLDSKDERKRVIKEELLEIKEKYKKFIPRRTEVVPMDEDQIKITEEDLIKEEDVAVILTQSGYIKRIPLSLYETQRRGGKGKRAMKVRDDDFIKDVFIASTHNYLLILTSEGKLYWLKVYEIPEGSRTAKGKPIESMVALKPDEKLSTVVQVEGFSEDEFIIMATKKGIIKKCKLSLFSNIRETGIIAITLREGDEIIAAKITTGEHEIVIGTKNGMACRFMESDIRPTGRTSIGVRAINLRENDEVIGMVTVEEKAEMNLLTVTKKGYGKRTRFGDYRKIRRGGIGVKNIDIKLRNDEVIYIKSISDEDELLLVSKKGNMVRLKASSINVLGRSAAGHIIMRFKEEDDELVGLGLVDL